MNRVVIIGGGPGGYEAALVARQLGGEVTLIDTDGMGGSAVLTDCVPSKTLIATAEVMMTVKGSDELGVIVPGGPGGEVEEAIKIDLARVNRRVLALAEAQSNDIHNKLVAEGVTIVRGRGRLNGISEVIADTPEGEKKFPADAILIATGAYPRELPAAKPDGERILTWTQVYNLDEMPEHLIVVGSGVTGAEFANAYDAIGVPVTLVSSRKTVLPGQDADAARVLQDVFERRGMNVMSEARAEAVTRDGDTVTVHLADGRTVTGSHCLMAVGSIPQTHEMGLPGAGVKTDEQGYIIVDRVSRTTARGVYAAGDCTGVLALASVAAMQGRIAMWHALGDAVAPLNTHVVSSNVFTSPEIATVGVTQPEVDSGDVRALTINLPLSGNARAKMQGIHDGFVKLFCLPVTGIIVGGVVVSPRASELIHVISLAVAEKITVDNFAQDFTVYPSLSGSIAEAARRLHGHSTDQLEEQIHL
ncbi:MAG: NAD(P)H-quinone dehydrogenase [Propionibacteriaceae bacterium]|nr:NAD(P)H-quinone dehydrogenase [Propionibacteriaceae bacterium]